MSDAEGPAASVERRGHVLVITLNRLEARNAANAAVSTMVCDALHAAQEDPEVRAVVTAGGEPFCAGADLKAVSRRENVCHSEHSEWGFAGHVKHYIDKPTIAAVNSTGLGGGTELALASDLVVPDERARFGLPEVKRGLVAGGETFRIVQQLPRKIAVEMPFIGEPVEATEALEWGLINQLAPEGAALDVAIDLAERIAANAPQSLWASKRVAYGIEAGDSTDPAEREAWGRTTREAGALCTSEDCTEGLLALADKRSPVRQAR